MATLAHSTVASGRLMGANCPDQGAALSKQIHRVKAHPEPRTNPPVPGLSRLLPRDPPPRRGPPRQVDTTPKHLLTNERTSRSTQYSATISRPKNSTRAALHRRHSPASRAAATARSDPSPSGSPRCPPRSPSPSRTSLQRRLRTSHATADGAPTPSPEGRGRSPARQRPPRPVAGPGATIHLRPVLHDPRAPPSRRAQTRRPAHDPRHHTHDIATASRARCATCTDHTAIRPPPVPGPTR